MDAVQRAGAGDVTVPVPVAASSDGVTVPVPVAAAPTAGLGGLGDAADPWVTLADGRALEPLKPLPGRRRTLLQLGLAALGVFALVVVGTSFAASRLAEREAVNDAAHTTNLLALSVVQPAVSDALADGDAAAYAAFDKVVRESVMPNGIVRVKLWRPDGTIVYADETRLVGQRFELGEEQLETLSSPQTKAEVSELDRSENEFERYGGKLLEVYRPVWTPTGRELLFEVYGDYGPVQDRANGLWRGLVGVLATSLLLLLVLMAPVVLRLLDRLSAAQRHREAMLRRTLEASEQERRRIAADLRDGPVQDLVGSSLAVSGAAATARAEERGELAATISDAAVTVRASVAGLRTLLVEIYPARLAEAGLAEAIADLARPLTSRAVEVSLAIDPDAAAQLTDTEQQVVHRVTRECLRNVVKHAGASRVRLTLARDSSLATHPVVLTVEDDGHGFDARDKPAAAGHFGLRVLADLATEAGAVLQLASAVGKGTRVRLRMPVGPRT